MEQENGKELEMQANTPKKYVRNPIHIYGPGEEWRSNPIHFSDSLEEMKERENPQFSHLNETVNGDTMSKEEKQEKTVTSPLHFSEKYGINADAEQEEAKRFEENDRRASENERQQKLEKKADTEKIPDMDTKEKEGVKKNVPACENSEKRDRLPYILGEHISGAMVG